MNRKSFLSILIYLILPLVLYTALFWPFDQQPGRSLLLQTKNAITGIIIVIVQLGITIFTYKKLNGFTLAQAGLFSFETRTLLQIASGLVMIAGIFILGNIAFSLIYGIGNTPQSIQIQLDMPIWLLAVMMLGVGYCEEFFFRVYIPLSMEVYIGRKAAVLISAVLFAAGHLYEGLPAAILIFFLGLGFQFIYYKYRNIHANAVIHALFNVISVLLQA